jgi:hypothetical protein
MNETKESIKEKLLTGEQLAEGIFQMEYDEKHLTHLRRHGGLPYMLFQRDGKKIFRYPLIPVMKWVETRTHGSKVK